MNAAVEVVSRALYSPQCSFTTAIARGKLFFQRANLVESNAAKLTELETRDIGKIIRETSPQIADVAEFYRYYAGLADKIEGNHLPSINPIWRPGDDENRLALLLQ